MWNRIVELQLIPASCTDSYDLYTYSGITKELCELYWTTITFAMNLYPCHLKCHPGISVHHCLRHHICNLGVTLVSSNPH